MYTLKEFVLNHSTTVGLSIVVLIIYVVARVVMFKLIRTRTKKGKIANNRAVYIRKITHFMLILLVLSILGAIWEISIQGLSVYFASIFTVVGVALFATWSILSNITASVILFFFFPYRIGHTVRIIDGDNSQEGKIEDLNLFYIKIKTTDGQSVAYPNSLAVQKPIALK